jgi:hypothetical protein
MAHPARRQVWGRSSSDGEGSEVERLAEDERGDWEDVSLRIWVILPFTFGTMSEAVEDGKADFLRRGVDT